MSGRMTEAELDDQVTRLAAMSDDDVDTDDIPETSAENLVCARRPDLYRPRKRPVTIRLDADVIARFQQAGPGWQTRVNAVLRKAAGLG